MSRHPFECSRITNTLFVGTTPHSKDYAVLREIGIDLVINMRFDRRPHSDPLTPQIPKLWLRTIDTPFTPIPLAVLRRGVYAALETIGSGGKVYTHCYAGVHRSVAMAACILIAQDYSVEAAMGLIKQQRPVADPDAWYIRRRIRRFAATWARQSQ